jgi:hypothetical protein
MAAADSLIGEGLAPSPYAEARGAYDDLMQICIRWMWVAGVLAQTHGHTPETRTVSIEAVRLGRKRRTPVMVEETRPAEQCFPKTRTLADGHVVIDTDGWPEPYPGGMGKG